MILDDRLGAEEKDEEHWEEEYVVLDLDDVFRGASIPNFAYTLSVSFNFETTILRYGIESKCVLWKSNTFYIGDVLVFFHVHIDFFHFRRYWCCAGLGYIESDTYS
jgi:hypothetical protein